MPVFLYVMGPIALGIVIHQFFTYFGPLLFGWSDHEGAKESSGIDSRSTYADEQLTDEELTFFNESDYCCPDCGGGLLTTSTGLMSDVGECVEDIFACMRCSMRYRGVRTGVSDDETRYPQVFRLKDRVRAPKLVLIRSPSPAPLRWPPPRVPHHPGDGDDAA